MKGIIEKNKEVILKRYQRKWKEGQLKGKESKGKEMKMDVMDNEVSELIESLKNLGRVLTKIQKELPIPIIGGEDN